MKVLFIIPVTDQMSPCQIVGTSSTVETASENALWEYNSRRDHDGLPPLARLPRGTIKKLFRDILERVKQ